MIYVHEFLWRGREPGSAETPAWHVILADVGTDGFGQPTRSERTLNVAQATEAGFDLDAIVAGINTAALTELEALRAEVEAQRAELEELRGRDSPAEAPG
jgi:hypothetical protein